MSSGSDAIEIIFLIKPGCPACITFEKRELQNHLESLVSGGYKASYVHNYRVFKEKIRWPSFPVPNILLLKEDNKGSGKTQSFLFRSPGENRLRDITKLSEILIWISEHEQ